MLISTRVGYCRGHTNKLKLNLINFYVRTAFKILNPSTTVFRFLTVFKNLFANINVIPFERSPLQWFRSLGRRLKGDRRKGVGFFFPKLIFSNPNTVSTRQVCARSIRTRITRKPNKTHASATAVGIYVTIIVNVLTSRAYNVYRCFLFIIFFFLWISFNYDCNIIRYGHSHNRD